MPTCTVNGCGRAIVRKDLCNKHYQKLMKYGDPSFVFKHSSKSMDWILSNLNYSGTECLMWPFGRGGNGYGRVVGYGRNGFAHSIMLELVAGPRPNVNSNARHLCGRGRDGCVNPRHLIWGTPKENSEDTVKHGRSAKGEKSGRSKLKETQVHEIRRKIAEGLTQQEIADQYGIHRVHVSQIKLGKAWAWLPSRENAA